MEDIRTTHIRLNETTRAIGVLKATPGYPTVYVRIHDALKAHAQEIPGVVNRLTAQRRDIELMRLHIQAQAYLDLVSNRKTQDAYILVLHGLSREAWERFSGIPMEHCATPQDLVPFQSPVAHWIAEGYKRIISREAQKSADSAVQAETLESLSIPVSNSGAAQNPQQGQPTPPQETVGHQIRRLFEECGDITEATLAALVEIDVTSVSRHMNAKMEPSRNNIAKYKRAFSKLLKRDIVILKTPSKRQVTTKQPPSSH